MGKLKDLIKKSEYGKLLVNYKRIIFQKLNLLLYSDEKAIRRLYKKRCGRVLELDNPKRFTEKLQWQKLYYRNPIMTRIVDKIACREYLKEIDAEYERYLVPIVGIYRSVDEIDFEALPEKCIFKASHGSSMHLVKNGPIKNVCAWKKIMKSWLKMNIYVEGREWPYKNVQPGIICEEFMEAQTENALKDYKFFCFDGKVAYVYGIADRALADRVGLGIFTPDFELLPYRRMDERPLTRNLEKPINYEQMVLCAEKLSQPFPHARVDLYNVDGKILFGEISPSGKLPVTFYNDTMDLPEFEDYSMKGRTYKYLESAPLYPFGYGLTYADCFVESASYDKETNTVKAVVTNASDVATEEVVQVYVKAESEFAPTNGKLCGFARVSLSAKESKEVTHRKPARTEFLEQKATNKKG